MVPSSSNDGIKINDTLSTRISNAPSSPEPKCLRPTDYLEVPTLTGRSNTSLAVRVGAWRPAPECAKMSLPRTRYTVRYRKVKDPGDPNLPPCNHSSVTCQKQVGTLSPTPQLDTEQMVNSIKVNGDYTFLL